MTNYTINKDDLEQLEAILRNNKNIERLYQKLSMLELEGKKDTEEYTKLLNYLSIVIEVENSLYKEANLTTEKTLSWLKFLRGVKDNTSSIITRINTHLFNQIIKTPNNINSLPDKELQNILTMAGIKLTQSNTPKEEIAKSITIKETIQKDLYYTYISFLQEYIDNPRNIIFKKHLLTSKYEGIFLNKDIESYAITNNFNLPNIPYSISQLINDLLQIDPKIYNKIKNLLCSKILSNEIYELLETSDTNYSDIEKSSQAVLRECMIKSCLLFISDEEINKIKTIFYKFIEDKEYTTIHPNSNVSEGIIKNCFNNINKNKIKILSLK